MNPEIIHFNPHDAEHGDFYPYVRINGGWHRVKNFRRLYVRGFNLPVYIGILTYPMEIIGLWTIEGKAIATDGSVLIISEYTLYLIKHADYKSEENPTPLSAPKHSQHSGVFRKYWGTLQNRIYKLFYKS
jgi:hypothetical protein